MEYCNQCGNQINNTQIFCSDCGSRIEEVPPISPHLPTSSSTREYRSPTLWLQLVIVLLGLAILLTTVVGIIIFLSEPFTGLIFVPLLFVEVWIFFNLPKYHNGARYLLVLLSGIFAIINAYLYVIGEVPTVVPLLIALFAIFVLMIDHDTAELFSGKYHSNNPYSS